MKRFVIANWKLYVREPESARRARAFVRSLRAVPPSVIPVLCPSTLALPVVSPIIQRSRVILGAQNVSMAEDEAATGSVGIDDLKALGCRYVIVGHSERRALGETDAVVAKKLRLVVRASLTPILCVGEPWSVRRHGKQNTFVPRQLRAALKEFSGKHLLVAYEPVWAISKHGRASRTCTPDAAAVMRHLIERQLVGLLRRWNTHTSTLYGGSVTSRSIAQYIHAGFDGALVGFASTKSQEYATIVKTVARITNHARLTQKTGRRRAPRGVRSRSV